MNKKQTIFIACMFLFSTVAFNVNTGHAALDNIKEGDTIYYKVSTYTLPLSDLVPEVTEIDLSQVQLDLSGSTIGVKVMQKWSTKGAYLLNSFLILGNSIVVPFPDGTPTEVTDIFGDSLTIPSGVGISLGLQIPGSNFVSLLNSDSSDDYPGIPVYIETTQMSAYKTELDAIATTAPDGITLTTTDGTDGFEVVFHAQDTNNSITVTLKWFKTGDNAGLFNSFDLTGTVKNSANTDVNIAFGFSFDHKENVPLPTEIVNKQQQTISIENLGFDFTYSGTLFDELLINFNQTALDEVKTQILELKGENILRYTIDDVQGMYYKTRLDIKDFDTNSFEPGSPMWFNGFTGLPTEYDTTCAPECLNFNMDGFNFFPLLAPGITPDWTVWQANMKTVNSLASIVTSTLSSSAVSNQLITLGLKIDEFTSAAQLREQGDFKYFYSEGSLRGSYDASQASASNRPSGFDGTEKGTLTATSNAWSSYSKTGLTAGYGAQFNVTLSLDNIPLNATFRGDGTVTVGIVAKLKNNAFTTLPDGKDATPIGGGGGLLPGVPGFETIPVIFVLVAIPLISRKKRNN